jgi:Methyltransferase domain
VKDGAALTRYAAEQVGTAGWQVPHCKVCAGETRLFDVLDLGRQCNLTPYPDGLIGVPVYFHRCTQCGLVFTGFFDRFDSELWSRHIYNADYARIDPEYGGVRSARDAKVVRAAMGSWWPASGVGCDYGGGQGHLAAHLRGLGLRFDTLDPFGVQHVSVQAGSYAMVTAFEVMEHFAQPEASFAEIAALAAPQQCLLLASTSLVDPRMRPGELAQWWYAAPRNGHITLYAEATMRWLANAHSFEYRRITRGLHLFGRGVALDPIARAVLVNKVAQRLHLR